ncbi:MAG TPA: alpha-amylase family glycosyl hydrolase [Candidatus Limnocylindria bacterium]|nr:alpha-amylase family glycosyl hydrolase [Candidatus Limnocylindria bacterium]
MATIRLERAMPLANAALPSFPLRRHPHLYEINTWAWLEQLSARLCRRIALADVPDGEWAAIARLGFDAVWLMGVWQRSPESRRIALEDPANFAGYDAALPGWKPADIIGSPYAVPQYIPDLRIGTWESLDRVREKLRGLGMALFLDFVGNHTALDHPWTRDHPEFYVRGTQQDFENNPSSFFPIETPERTYYLALARDPYFPPWKDVAQLNHFEPAMRAAQLADLRTIASHCDGVRCDMAMLHLNDIFGNIWRPLLQGAIPPEKEFWAEARGAIPDLILLAEAYWDTEPRLLELGFSYAYDKELYDAVRDRKIGDVRARISTGEISQSRLARFLENHDEPRRPNVFGNERLRAVGTLMATLPGMRFYHQGELEGLKVHLPITLRISAAEPLDPISAFCFHKLLEITDAEVFHAGRWSLLEVTADSDDTSANLLVYEWRLEKTWKIVVVNLAGCASQGRVKLGDRVSPAQQYVFHDQLNEDRYLRSGHEIRSIGLFVRREAGQAHLFDVTPA